ncbi:hypothetical protein BKA64DRAFT_656364 [Cadophora sp. MPI-SDFR-AT-0126]|nr:hypothetical protein BKA64DRAFT_656364 [Leotiomycetes sp. MPI-SDFR-AT-0126]
MHLSHIFTTLALLAPLILVYAQTDTNDVSQTVGISSALEPTCPTITVTTGSTCPQITPVCVRPLCIEISTITQPCSCDSVPTVTNCPTACGKGCATSTSVAYLPCPVSPSGTETGTGTGTGTGSMPTQTTSYGNGTVTMTPTATTSMVIATGAAVGKGVSGRGGLILGIAGVLLGFL